MLKRISLIASAATVAVLAIVATAVATPAKSSATAATAKVTCGKVRSIGIATPITGPAASLGAQQLAWAQFYVSQWNKQKIHKNSHYTLVQGDTQLPNAAEAIKVAQKFASTSKILAVVGPAGSQEVQDTTAAFAAGGLAFISGSATRTALTDGTRKGFFFRVVPNDGQQSPAVADYITGTLKSNEVYIIDDQEAYSTGLSDEVGNLLKAKSVKVTRDSVSQSASDFSSLIAKIPTSTKVIYIPWQLSAKAQLFGQQLKAAGKNIPLFGSDGLFDPGNFTIAGAYDSFFPVDVASATIKAYANAHGGKQDYFGVPSYVAAQVAVNAVEKACKTGKGKTTRAAVRKAVASTKIQATLLGIPVSFTANGDVRGGGFTIYKIGTTGVYSKVG
jgi:branched-chain amino acid transport system substrate-binding protein